MTRLIPSDLALLRETEHYTDLHLSIFQPTVALQCQVNDAAIARGERTITYDNVTSGSWQNVKIGATLLVGSSVGERNVGKVRVKSITSSEIEVAENSHINWANDLYLTILNYFDVWPIFPRIIQDPADAESTIWYKDYDVAYTNQNENLGAFINIGPHRAAFIEPETNNALLYYSASGTYALGNAITSYKWTFEGGNPSTSANNTPGDVAYTGSGHYLTTFEASGTGWVETAYRYVSIYDRPNAGVNIPTEKWTLSNLSGSRGEGGWRATVTVFEPITVHEGSVVVFFADEWYGSTKKSLGGNAPNAEKIKFVGYVMNNSIRYNYKESSVSFEIGSITQIMKEMVGFAIELQSQASPSTWYEMPDVNGKKATYHYWKWHSNVIQLADIQWIGDDYLIQYFDSDRESIFDAVDNLLRTSYLGSVVSDRQGKIFLEIDAFVQANATGTFTPLFTVNDYDWMETPEVTEQRYPPLSYAEYNGIAYSGVVTGSYTPLMSEVPGTAPAYRGGLDRRPGFAVLGQDTLNQIVGNVFAHENAQYPNIDIPFKGNYSNLDIAPQEALNIVIPAADTARGQLIEGLYIPNNLSFTFNPETKVLLVRGGLNVLTSGEAGETVVIPEIVDDGGYGGPRGFKPPKLTIPSIPFAPNVGSFIQTKFGPSSIKPSGPLPEYGSAALTVTYQTGVFGFASGTYSGASGTQSVYIPYSGFYRLSLNGISIYPGSDVDNLDDTHLGIIVDGVMSDQSVLPHLGNIINDGNTNFYSFGDYGGFTVNTYFAAGTQLSIGFAIADNTPTLAYTIRGYFLVEYRGS